MHFLNCMYWDYRLEARRLRSKRKFWMVEIWQVNTENRITTRLQGSQNFPLFLGVVSVYANSVLRVERLRPVQHVSGNRLIIYVDFWGDLKSLIRGLKDFPVFGILREWVPDWIVCLLFL